MSHVHKISPNLWFDTQAEQAAEFYTGIFPNSQVTRIARYPEAGEEIHKMTPGSIMTVDFELAGGKRGRGSFPIGPEIETPS